MKKLPLEKSATSFYGLMLVFFFERGNFALNFAFVSDSTIEIFLRYTKLKSTV